jgi:hypothetical protein
MGDRVWDLHAPLGEHWHWLPSGKLQLDLIKNWEPPKAELLFHKKSTWFWADQGRFDPTEQLGQASCRVKSDHVFDATVASLSMIRSLIS